MDTAKKKIHCIVHCITPIHFVSSLSAIRTLHRDDEVEVTIIEHWPGLGKQPLQELLQVVTALSEKIYFVQAKIGFDQAEYAKLLSLGREGIEERLHALTGKTHCEEIYFPHDNTGSLYQLLCTLYPHAKRICFGDGLGTVYEKKFQLSLFKPALITQVLRWPMHTAYTLWQKVKSGRMLKNTFEKALHKSYEPHVAVLILPTDHSGRFFNTTTLLVVPKDVFLDTLKLSTQSASEFQAVENQLLAQARGKIYLLLTNNFTESGLTEFSTEIEMWCSIIKQNCAPHGTVIIKNHPGEKLQRNVEIQRRLGQDYHIVWFDPKFNRYPVELMSRIIVRATVICFSASMLSIKYAFNVLCVNPFTPPFIHQWFPGSKKLIKNALQLYTEPLARLDQWDGKSLIWSPNTKTRPKA